MIHPTNQYPEFWNTPKKCNLLLINVHIRTYFSLLISQNGETVHVTKYLSQFRFSYTPSDKEASEVCAKKRTQILSAVLSHTFDDRILSRGGGASKMGPLAVLSHH